MSAPNPLFRPEVLEHQRTSWLGPILLIRPPAFATLTLVAMCIAVVTVAYLALGEYTKKARVTGYLTPEHGMLKVFAPQAGTVREQRAREGQHVRRGDTLLVLSNEHAIANVLDTQAAIGRELEIRKTSLHNDRMLQQQQFQQQETALSSRLENMRSELVQLGREIETQRNRVQVASITVERYRQLQVAKYISEIQFQQKSDELLDQQGRLQALERNRIGVEREVRSVEAEMRGLPLKSQVAFAAIDRGISELDQQRTESDARRETAIIAPDSGTVTAILTESGQAVNPTVPLLSIVPEDARLEAHLFAPSRAIGFIEPGRRVLLRYHAFPYQKFGQYEGTVTSISKTALPPSEMPLAMQGNEPMYRITVALNSQTATAYGNPQSLQAGMQLEADILLDRRRLIEWVFEPLFSLTGRV